MHVLSLTAVFLDPPSRPEEVATATISRKRCGRSALLVAGSAKKGAHCFEAVRGTTCLVFLVTFLQNCRKYHVIRLLRLMILAVRCEVFVWKASKHEGFCMVDITKQQEAATRASQSNRQRLRSNNKRNRRHKPHSHGRHHPLPPELKDKCKSKLACAKSRESAKTPQKPMQNATRTGKHRKKQCEMES